jgi:hypothetical protein
MLPGNMWPRRSAPFTSRLATPDLPTSFGLDRIT